MLDFAGGSETILMFFCTLFGTFWGPKQWVQIAFFESWGPSEPWRAPWAVQGRFWDPKRLPRGSQEAPKRLPRGSKSTSEGSKRLPRRSKRLPRGTQERQTAPKKLQKASKSSIGLVFVSHCFDLLQTPPRLRLGFD